MGSSGSSEGGRYSKTVKEKDVSNNAVDRVWSDGLDRVMGWKGGYKETSEFRAAIHSRYHERIANKKE